MIATRMAPEPDRSSYGCLCCGCWTLEEAPPGTFAICPVCGWEDDNVQAADPTYAGGANTMSLEQARASFRTIGAISPEALPFVRPPTADEHRDTRR